MPLAFATLFCLLPISMMFTTPAGKFLLGESKTTSGTVIEVANERRSKQLEITYKFRAIEGPEYRNTESVRDDSPYATVRPEESVPVEFLVSDPSVNRIASGDATNHDFLVLILIFPLFITFFLVAPIFLPRFIQVFRDRNLYRKGILANAFVIFIKPCGVFAWSGWSGLYSADVYLRFQLGSGAIGEARTRCRNDWLLKQLTPGTPVHIAYSPKRPSRVALLGQYVR